MMRAPKSDLPISIQRISVATDTVTILKDVTMTLTKGEPTVLIGPNGSGKTTLLRVAMGLLAPTSGQVTWGGRLGVPPERRAILFQRPVMLRRTAGSNIRYALRDTGAVRQGRVSELLRLVGLEGLEDRPARRLSGGEQQRLGFARALAREPEVLFLDEPAASLDPAATKNIEDLIRDVSSRGIKIVMTTHDLGQARRLAGDITLLHRGSVVETGDAQSFFTAPQSSQAQRFLAGDLLI
jgi:tungstate transport system ATP-binding protein